MTHPQRSQSVRDEVPREATFGGRRLLGLSLLFVGLSALGLYAVYSRVAERALSWDARLLSLPVVFSCLALLLVYFTADGLRLWFTLRTLQQRIRFPVIVRLVFMNIFVSNVTPLATGGGFAQAWYLQRRGVPVGTALTATTIRTVLAVLFIFGATPVLLVTLPGAEAATRGSSLVTTLVVCVCLYLGFFMVLLTRPGWLVRPALRALRLMHWLHLINEERQHRWQTRVMNELHRFAAGFRHYFEGRWYDIVGSLASTAIFLMAMFSFPVVLCWGLGYNLDYWVVVGRLVITTFVMYFSPTPGASGVAEGVFGHFFSDVLTAGHLVLVTVAWRTLTIYLGMGIGVFVTQRELARPMPGRVVPQ